MNVPVLAAGGPRTPQPSPGSGSPSRTQATRAVPGRRSNGLPSTPNFKVTAEVWIVKFEERQGPTLVHTPGRR